MSANPHSRLIPLLVAICLILSSSPTVALAKSTIDTQDHWAEEAMDRWVDRGIVKGYEDGTFGPNRFIKRAEFVALINRTFGYATLSSTEFPDVSDDDWFAADVSKAVGAGYIKGYDDGTFRPDDFITRQEAALVFARIYELEETDETYDFVDIESIPDWSRWAVVAVAKAGLMTGYPDGSFGPAGNIKRAETVTVLDRLVAEVFTEEGTYGSPDEETVIDGNVIVLAENVELCNFHIKGNLLVAESVDEGTVTLDRVNIDGEMLIRGGGSDSIVLKNTKVLTLIIGKEGVRVVILDGTRVTEAYVKVPSKVEQDTEGEGIEALTIEEIFGDGEVVLSGGFSSVSIRAESGRIVVDGGRIDEIIVESTAADVALELGSNASVKNLVLNPPATVEGTGTIETATVNVSGAVIEQQPVEVVLGEGVTAIIAGKDVVETPPVDIPDEPYFPEEPEPAQTLAETKTSVEGVLSEFTATNETAEADLLAAVEAFATNEKITVTIEDFAKTEATTEKAGSITGRVRLVLDSEENVVEMRIIVRPETGFIVPEIVSTGTDVVVSSVDKCGALYGMRFKEIINSVDSGTSWTTIWEVSEPRWPNQILSLDNGALLVILGGNNRTGDPDGCIYLSDTNQEHFTKVLETPRGCVGVSYGSFVYDSFVLLSEYGAKLANIDSPRRVYLSEDYGTTWDTILALDNHINVHTHNVTIDTFTGRIWVTVGDQAPERNAYFTDDRGETWSTLWPSDECPINPLSIACLPDCVLIGSDNFNHLSFWRYNKDTEKIRESWRLDTPGKLQVTLASAIVPTHKGYLALVPTHSDPARTDCSMLISTNGITFHTLWRQQDKTDNLGRLIRLVGIHNNAIYLQPVPAGNLLKFALPE